MCLNTNHHDVFYVHTQTRRVVASAYVTNKPDASADSALASLLHSGWSFQATIGPVF